MNSFSQDEANSDTYVSFPGNELWFIQEDGNICAHPLLAYLDIFLIPETSEPNLPQKGR